jgi:hypothetical protein
MMLYQPTVPNVQGLPQDAATAASTEAKLMAAAIFRIQCSLPGLDTVLGQADGDRHSADQ